MTDELLPYYNSELEFLRRRERVCRGETSYRGPLADERWDT